MLFLPFDFFALRFYLYYLYSYTSSEKQNLSRNKNDYNISNKKICVNPHAQLSLQLHHHRAEHWIIAEGEGVVTLGDKKINVKKDDAVYIPVETKHRIQNDSSHNLTFIEVQTGDFLDEDDIERFEDIYGRV